MKRVLLLPLAIFCTAPLWIAAPSSNARDSGANTSDVQNLVFLGDARPVVVRLHLRIDGKPFREAWQRFVRALFDYLDVDGDGVLSQRELARVPKPAFMLQVLRGNLMAMSMPRASARQPGEYQLNLVPGKVTRDGLAQYYRLSGVEPFVALMQDRSELANALTDALFKEIDTNRDEKLSKQEVLDAAATLRRLDLNDDELVSIDELLPAYAAGMAMAGQRDGVQVLSDGSAFLVLGPESSPTRLAAAILSHYDKDENSSLSRTEIGLEKAVFDRLDANKDGELDVEELARFLTCQPLDGELLVQMGSIPTEESPGELTPAAGDSSLGPLLRRLETGSLAMTLGDVHIDLGVNQGLAANLKAGRQFLLGQFHELDKQKQGFLDRTAVQNNPTLNEIFPLADRDGNGKLTEAEVMAYFELLGRAVGSSCVLMITDHGQALFDLLDPHHDGRLRQREMRTAWPRLAIWDKDGDGLVSRGELPHQFQLQLSQGQPGQGLPVAQGVILPGAGLAAGSSVAKGPLWFRKMDRNGDGVVSRREFLGSREEFQRIDTDGDGLITPEEAIQADARYRAERKK